MIDFSKYILPMLALGVSLMVLSCASMSKKKSTTIAGQITYKNVYCGGAAPSPEILAELEKDQFLGNYKLYLKQGRENDIDKAIVAETKTDAEGKFSFSVPKGDYVLLSVHQLNYDIFNKQTHIKIVDKDKLEKWWKSGLTSLEADQQVQLHWRKRCHLPLGVPGLRYTGPMAP